MRIFNDYKGLKGFKADYVRATFSQYDITFDTRLSGGCSRRRPDISIDYGSHLIIVEVDENQHQRYDLTCDHRRLMELFLDGGSRPLMVIRFNPDDYLDSNHINHPSCWGYTRDKGLCVVKPRKVEEWNHRLETLKHTIEHACANGGSKEIDVLHLFYDEWEDKKA